MILAASALMSGLALVAAVFPVADSRCERAFRIAAGAALGLGASGALSMALRLCKLPTQGKDIALVIASAIALAAVRARGLRLGTTVERGSANRMLAAATALAAVLVLLLFVEHTVRYPDGGWDARAIWNLRARALHRAPLRLDLVLSPEMLQSHPDYPLLLPALVADAFAVAGEESYGSGAIAFAFSALLVAVAATGAGTLRGADAGFVAALIVLGFPALLQMGWSQCADVPLATFFATACALALLSRGRPGALALAGFAAALCALTKNEGLVWAAALCVAMSTAMGKRACASFLLGAVPGLLLLATFKFRFAPPNNMAAATTVAGLASRITDPWRAVAVVRGLVAQLWNFPMWGLTGPALAVAAAWPPPRAVSPEKATAARVLRRTLALCSASVFVIYLIAPHEVETLLPSSADRLLMQLAGVAVLLACLFTAGVRPLVPLCRAPSRGTTEG
ncbi:MAG: hypothetical protein ACJ79M_18180 [Myxococcales bacterium]